jgi:hypothetical protein
MVTGVALTFLRAGGTRLGARLHDRSGALWRKLCLPAHHTSGCHADIAAVLTQPDTSDHHADVILTQATISTGCAGLNAIETRFDARNHRPRVDRSRPGMSLPHLLSVSHDSSLLGWEESSAVSMPSQPDSGSGA